MTRKAGSPPGLSYFMKPAPMGSQGLVGSIAQGAVLAVLAGAEPDLTIRLGLVFHRLKAGALVGTIAKGLLGAAATGAPPVAFSGFDLYGQGGFLGNHGCGHDKLLLGQDGWQRIHHPASVAPPLE